MIPLRRLRRAAIDVEPLRHPAFRRLWLGNSLGFIGFQLTAVAVPVQVFELTGSSFWVGMLGLVGLVPLVMFGLWGGAVADAVDRRLLLLGSSLLLWGCTGGLLVAALLGLASLPLLLGLVAVQAAGFAVAFSTRGAIVPRVLPASLVPSANTLSFTASNLGMVAGPLLAGLILARWSFAAAYAADLAVSPSPCTRRHGCRPSLRPGRPRPPAYARWWGARRLEPPAEPGPLNQGAVVPEAGRRLGPVARPGWAGARPSTWRMARARRSTSPAIPPPSSSPSRAHGTQHGRP